MACMQARAGRGASARWPEAEQLTQAPSPRSCRCIEEEPGGLLALEPMPTFGKGLDLRRAAEEAFDVKDVLNSTLDSEALKQTLYRQAKSQVGTEQRPPAPQAGWQVVPPFVAAAPCRGHAGPTVPGPTASARDGQATATSPQAGVGQGEVEAGEGEPGIHRWQAPPARGPALKLGRPPPSLIRARAAGGPGLSRREVITQSLAPRWSFGRVSEGPPL